MLNITNQKNPDQNHYYELRFNIQKNDVIPYNYTIIKKFRNKNIITEEDINEMFIKDLKFLKNYQLYYNFKIFNNLKLDPELPNNYLVSVLSRNQIININSEENGNNLVLISVMLILFVIFLLVFNFYTRVPLDLVIIENQNDLFKQNKELFNNYFFTVASSMNFIFNSIFFILSLILYYLNFLDFRVILSSSYYINAYKKGLFLKSFFQNEAVYIKYDFISNMLYSFAILIGSILINIVKTKKIHNEFVLLLFLIPCCYLINVPLIFFENYIIKRSYEIINLVINILGIAILFFDQYMNNHLYIYTIIINNIFQIGILILIIFHYDFYKLINNIEILDLINNYITFTLLMVYLFKNVYRLPKILELKKIIFKKKIDFIGFLVHELKTPLMNIKTRSDMILEDKSMNQDILKNHIHSIISSSNTLNSLIEDFLMFSKTNISITKVRIQKCNIDKIKNEINIIINNLNPEFKINYNINEKIIYIDRIKIIQILINFLTNAIKYSNTSEVELIIQNDISNHIYISVKDSGVGISYTRLFNLVHPFSRQRDNIKETKRNGDGLGLYICKEFISYMDGIFYIKTAIDKGSEFGFYLPHTPVFTNEEEVLIIDSDDKKKKILIYDDDNLMKNIYKYFLSKFNITIAKNEIELIELIKTQTYDLLIIDYYLQGMTGLDAIKILKEYNTETKTLIVSGYKNLLLVKSNLIDDLLEKPFDKNILLQKIAKLIF